MINCIKSLKVIIHAGIIRSALAEADLILGIFKAYSQAILRTIWQKFRGQKIGECHSLQVRPIFVSIHHNLKLIRIPKLNVYYPSNLKQTHCQSIEFPPPPHSKPCP